MANGESEQKQNAWIVGGAVLLVVIAGAVTAWYSRGARATLTLPGELTPTQVEALKALEERFRAEAANQPPVLTAEQISALQGREQNPSP
jgi:glutathione S-transferase